MPEQKKQKETPKEEPKQDPILDKIEIPDDIKKKLEQIKDKLDKFKNEVLKKFDKYITGIALLPPEKKPQQTQPEKDISILVFVDDSDSKKMSRYELKDKLFRIIDKIAVDIDKAIKPEVMLLSELRESCFDAKYEVLKLISMSASIYDPKDLIAALRVSEVHKTMVLQKFDKYIFSYVAVGSLFRGDAKSFDIDVAVIVDDTDVKKMGRAELRDKLGNIIRTMGYDAAAITGVKKQFHIQVYILTDFWESIKEASPVMFTFLRDGVPLHDKGVFMPWKLLLEMGRIRPSPEAIDMHLALGDRLLERVKGKLLGIVAEDIYYAVLNPSQAALMLYGIPPTTPKETIELLDEIFVKKEKILEEKYLNILKKVRDYYKDIEHAKIKDVTGKEVDELMQDSQDYLKRINKLFQQIEKKTESKRVEEFYETCTHAVEDVLKLENIPVKEIEKDFAKLVNTGKFPKTYLDNLKDIIKVKKEQTKITKQEFERVRRETSSFVRAMLDYVQAKRGKELEKAKIKFKYGDKFGEIYLLEDTSYIVNDIDAKEKVVSRSKIMPDGSLGEIKDSNLAELEDTLMHAKIPDKVFIKEKIFEDLRKLFGRDIEVLVSN